MQVQRYGLQDTDYGLQDADAGCLQMRTLFAFRRSPRRYKIQDVLCVLVENGIWVE